MNLEKFTKKIIKVILKLEIKEKNFLINKIGLLLSQYGVLDTKLLDEFIFNNLTDLFKTFRVDLLEKKILFIPIKLIVFKKNLKTNLIFCNFPKNILLNKLFFKFNSLKLILVFKICLISNFSFENNYFTYISFFLSLKNLVDLNNLKFFRKKFFK